MNGLLSTVVAGVDIDGDAGGGDTGVLRGDKESMDSFVFKLFCETAAADTFDHYFLQTRYPYYICYFATNRKTSSIDNVQDKMIPRSVPR